MTTRIKAVLLASGLALTLSAPPALAQTPTEFTYQGVLTGPGGPVTTSVEIVFLLFDAPVNGNIQGDPIFVNLTPVDGVFTVPLDFGAEAFATNQPLWLQMDVTDNSDPNNSDSFRQPLTSAPYALNTRGIGVDENNNVSFGTIDSPATTTAFGQLAVDGFLSLGDSGLFFDDWDISSNQGSLFFNSDGGSRMVIDDGGFVGIGTTDPASTLSVVGDLPNDINQVGVHLGTSSFDFSGIRIVSPTDVPSFVDFRGVNQGANGFGARIGYFPNTNILGVEQAKFRVLEDMDIFGKLGVGIEFPQSRLSLRSDENSRLLGFGSGTVDDWSLQLDAVTKELILTRFRSQFNIVDAVRVSEFGAVRLGPDTVGPGSIDAMLGIKGGPIDPLPLKVDVGTFPGHSETAAEFIGDVKIDGDLDVPFGTVMADRIVSTPPFDGAPPGFLSIDAGGVFMNTVVGVGGSISNGETQLVAQAMNNPFITSILKANNAGFQTVLDVRTNGQVFCNGGLLCSSDASMKHDIDDLDGALDAVLTLRGVTFHWNDDQPMHGAGEQIGFIAQEVEAVLPQLVSEADNGTKAVQYDKVTAVLVEAVKQQQAHITELTSRVNELESSASSGLFRSSVLWPMIAIGGIGGLALRRKAAPAS